MKPALFRLGLAFVAVVFTGGCTATRSTDIDAIPPASIASDPPSNRALRSNADLEDLVRDALAHNPTMAAAEARIQRMEARGPQARALPDPSAMVSLGSMAETAAGRVTSMSGLQQKIPLPGKLSAKGRMADEEARAARAMRDSKALAVATQVRNAYWDLYAANSSIRILNESRSLLSSVQSAVEARLKTNRATQGDLLQATTEVARVDEQLLNAQSDRVIARARLNTLLHRPPEATLPTPTWTSHIGNLPTETSLESHPSIAEAEARLRQFNAQLKLAHLERLPDLTLGIQHASIANSGLSRMSNGRDQIYGTLGFNIPLWQEPRRAAEREARSGIDESQANLEATRNELTYQLAQTRSQVETQKQLIRLFDDRILADARQTFDVSLGGYTSGNLSFIDVLDRWRSWLGYQLQQERNRALLGKSVAAWHQAAGILPEST